MYLVICTHTVTQNKTVLKPILKVRYPSRKSIQVDVFSACPLCSDKIQKFLRAGENFLKSRMFDSSLGHWLLLLATMQVIYHGLFMNSQLIQFKTHSYKINLYNGTFLLLTFKLLFVQENCNLGLSLLYLHSKLLQSLCQLCSSLKLNKQVQKLNLEASLKDFKKFKILFKKLEIWKF